MTRSLTTRWFLAAPCAALALFTAGTQAADIKARQIKFAFVNDAEHSQEQGATRGKSA